MNLKAIEERTFDMTVPELLVAVALRYERSVFFVENPKAAGERDQMPIGIIVPGEADGRLSALVGARKSIEFLIARMEAGDCP